MFSSLAWGLGHDNRLAAERSARESLPLVDLAVVTPELVFVFVASIN